MSGVEGTSTVAHAMRSAVRGIVPAERNARSAQIAGVLAPSQITRAEEERYPIVGIARLHDTLQSRDPLTTLSDIGMHDGTVPWTPRLEQRHPRNVRLQQQRLGLWRTSTVAKSIAVPFGEHVSITRQIGRW